MTTHADTDSATIVESFLASLARGHADATVAMLTDDIVWTNVGFPTLRGKARVARSIRALDSPRFGFDVIVHNIAADGDVVLTERTDLLRIGAVSLEFWVCGTFEIRDGRIAVWRDYFSIRNLLRGTAVGIARAVLGRRGGRSAGYLSGA
ncbi:limonene-1,2-epoxide hydrolase family protein [Rhodococcus sp. NPDC003318]|uniref:limonene-1,2-epoxide hydrolase family protein n=1 Tax=Rhodococcus sp. NPDC003318 TaxID=3364503 RepID=UPI0036AA8D84